MAWSGGTFTRTNGVNTGATTWATDAAAGVKIRSDRHDTHDQDLATGINQCINKDGSNTAAQLNVDNLRLDGNTVSSTNTNGNIEFSPNGTGLVNIAAAGDLAIAGTPVTSSAAEINAGCTGNISGSYTATATGMATSETGTVYYRVVGNIVHLELQTHITGVSTSTAFTLTGAPASIRPSSTSGRMVVPVVNNGAGEIGFMTMSNGGVLTMGRSDTSTTWTSSGNKSANAFSVHYMLTLPS